MMSVCLHVMLCKQGCSRELLLTVLHLQDGGQEEGVRTCHVPMQQLPFLLGRGKQDAC